MDNLDRNNIEINRGDLCKFVGLIDETGRQRLHEAGRMYLDQMCRVVNVCHNEIYCRVVFIRKNGTKYYTDIGKSYLEVDKQQTRKSKLKKLSNVK